MSEGELIFAKREDAARLALSMYAGEPCRICGQLLTMDDIHNGAVFAGYNDDNTSRAAHKRCWEGMLDVSGKRIAELEAELAACQGLSRMAQVDRIRDIIDRACADAKRDLRGQINGAVNWGDLGCAEIGTKNDGSGPRTYAVIEEAAPNSQQLIGYVQGKLREAGFDDVEVTTEW